VEDELKHRIDSVSKKIIKKPASQKTSVNAYPPTFIQVRVSLEVRKIGSLKMGKMKGDNLA